MCMADNLMAFCLMSTSMTADFADGLHDERALVTEESVGKRVMTNRGDKFVLCLVMPL